MSDDLIIRCCAFYLVLYRGSFILGGIGVFEIVFGLMIIVTRILVRFTCFQTYIKDFFGFKFKQPELMSHKPHPQIYSIMTIVFNLIMISL